MMWLLQIFLPLDADLADPFDIKEELSARFGGVTACNRAPAEGLWRDGYKEEKDDIVIVEVMADDLDRDWWHHFRRRLEHRINQKELVVLAQPLQRGF